MTDNSALIDTIAEYLRELADHFREVKLPDHSRGVQFVSPSAILAALREQWAVVRLPEPDSPTPSWRVMWDGEMEDIYPKSNGDIVVSGVMTLTAWEARGIGLALLAAADRAEGK